MEHSSDTEPDFGKQYRRVWAAFWLSFLATIAVAFIKVELALLPALVAFVCGWVSLLWRCPACGKRVGFKTFGLFMAGLPGARRCVHCSILLVRFTP
jgi:hypothetical protein